MTRFISRPKLDKAIAIAIASLILALGSGSRSLAQTSPDGVSSAPPQPPSAISADDLANLVAPIALYPDALLSQVLVASTYPLEVVEAQQWLRQNGFLHNRELMAAAQQQNWDPSVQALVAFPGVLALLNQNIRWTTDLGNAFLAQQSDVMNAIQNLRAQARGNGQLQSTPQLSVNTEVQGDQSAIEIQPANPQAMYVPYYNPSVVWGAPAEGSYPALPYAGSGFGSLFSTIANLAGFLPGFQGLLGLKSWGWALSWLAQALFVNNSFFSDFGFHNSGGGYGESSLWMHNPHHRLGVPYGSSMVAGRYDRERGRGTLTSRQLGNGWRTFGSNSRVASAPERRQPFAPRPSTGSQSFQRDNRSASNSRTFDQPNRSTARDRDPYFGNSAQNRARSFTGERSSTTRSFASSHDSFANHSYANHSFVNQGSTRSPEPSRSAKSSSWAHLPHFSKARMSSNGSSSQHGFSQRGFSQHAPKQKHFSEPKFKAPKFKAPHAPKSHGGGHASRGHFGSKSHRG
ncbi:MAG: DUF3300 domain-containing protein [Candidatus Sulfotelmatobacter sp.]